MKTTYLIAGILAVGLGAGVTSVAVAKQGGHERPSFEMLDANKDGKLTQVEMDAHKAQEFAKADTNGDGKLSSEEMLARAAAQQGARMGKRVARMMERVDTDNDGMLSAAELEAMPRGKGTFNRMDADKDGTITAEEFAAHKPGRGMRDGKHRGSGERSGHKWQNNNKPVTE